jgi:hypothetical protein
MGAKCVLIFSDIVRLRVYAHQLGLGRADLHERSWQPCFHSPPPRNFVLHAVDLDFPDLKQLLANALWHVHWCASGI